MSVWFVYAPIQVTVGRTLRLYRATIRRCDIGLEITVNNCEPVFITSLYKRALKEDMLGANTTLSGSLFQGLTTRWWNKSVSRTLAEWCFNNFLLLPLVCVTSDVCIPAWHRRYIGPVVVGQQPPATQRLKHNSCTFDYILCFYCLPGNLCLYFIVIVWISPSVDNGRGYNPMADATPICGCGVAVWQPSSNHRPTCNTTIKM